MTNAEIIAKACAARNIQEEVHTFAVWKNLGYSVKKGEHAAFSESIWKTVKNKKDEDKDVQTSRMFLTKAHFFKRSQVESIKEVETVG